MKSLTRHTIDLNCDLGEGLNNEAQLMPLISSCNISCGAHAGDLATINYAMELAKLHNLKVGAHPSFPDRENFGRRMMKMSSKALYDSLHLQIASIRSVLKTKKLKLHHVKPHGALYNLAAIDEETAKIIVNVMKSIDGNLVLYAPYQSVISNIAIDEGLPIKFEAFADRNYNEDLTLVSRSQEHALIQDPEAMFQHVYNMISNGEVNTINGVGVAIRADTFCVHGDGQKVVENLSYLIQKLAAHNVSVTNNF